jgi:hypothetical protein
MNSSSLLVKWFGDIFFCCPEAVSFTSKYITSIWGDREEEFSKKLQSLQAMKTLNHMEFEKTIDEFRSCVTEVIAFFLFYVAKLL